MASNASLAAMGPLAHVAGEAEPSGQVSPPLAAERARPTELGDSFFLAGVDDDFAVFCREYIVTAIRKGKVHLVEKNKWTFDAAGKLLAGADDCWRRSFELGVSGDFARSPAGAYASMLAASAASSPARAAGVAIWTTRTGLRGSARTGSQSWRPSLFRPPNPRATTILKRKPKMGTRHMIAVILDGGPRIAQYGQWDGYPEGQGVDVLAFAQGISDTTIPGMLDLFKAQVSKCRFLPEDEANAIFADSPWMSRDTGSDILDLVMKAPDGLPLFSSYKFARNGLMCEWAYVLDLDEEQLEVYKGFGKSDAPEGERFAGPGMDNSSGYGPVRLAKIYPFASLPDRDQFLKDLAESDDDEEEAA